MDIKRRGNFGEQKAADYLRLHGYKILDRNFSCRYGEVDIITSKGEYITFVEVKTRKNDSFAQAREFVTAAKQRRVIAAAEVYLAKNPTGLQPRFDVVEVYAPRGEKTLFPKINLIEDAFRL